MSCSNCFNGCDTVVSDKCVKYTGVDVSVLEIQKGDSLSYVQQALITFLTSTLDGTGIKLDIDEEIICTLVSQYLPDCEDISALNLFKALIQAACDLQEQIDVIEADYTVSCLDGVTSTSGTHAIVQAIITKLCEVETNLSTLSDAVDAIALDLDTNYVKIADLNSLIQAYLDETQESTLAFSKMVPYTVVEYYGPLSNYPTVSDGFAVDGAGFGYWENVYLCNGQNGTPDRRGRVSVGVTDGTMGGGSMSSTVDPAADPTFNPSYSLGDVSNGSNKNLLTSTQIPSHTHTANVTDPGHYTDIEINPSNSAVWTVSGGSGTPVAGVENINFGGIGTPQTATTTALATTGIGVTNTNTGGGEAHANIQPTIGAYFIMFIPA